MPADDPKPEQIAGGYGYVYAVTDPAEWAGEETSTVDPTLRTRDSRVLALVDGRRTVAEILLVSPFGHTETLEYLRSLSERRILRRLPGSVRPSQPYLAVGNVIVIDTRDRDKASPPQAPPNFPILPPAASGFGDGQGSGGPSPFKLGRYEVATRIGQGGMGSIYVCRAAGSIGPERLYTLKVVRQYADHTEIAEQSLLREGRIAGRLNHPNVQSVVETGTYKEQPFLILDYVAGVSLTDVLGGERRPPPAVIVSIMIDVLRGLEAAHNLRDAHGRLLGLVHGDVSPPNVLVGADGVARITDFGSSWISSDDRTRTNSAALGKPAYMAPEQLLADPLDARTDLFAVGAVLYVALTGHELFVADTYEQIAINVLRKRIAPPSELGAPSAVDEVCIRALNRSKEGRFQSAADMAHALFQTAAAQELVASPREVAEYMAREFGEVLEEQRRRIRQAFEEPAQGAGSSSLGWDAPTQATPAHGIPSDEIPDGYPEAILRADVKATAKSEKTLTKTLFLPGGEPGAEPLPAPRTPRPATRRPSGRTSTLRERLIAERRTIIIALAIGLTTLVATIAFYHPSPAKRPLSTTSHATAGPNH
jgi:hypothetical protein